MLLIVYMRLFLGWREALSSGMRLLEMIDLVSFVFGYCCCKFDPRGSRRDVF